MGCSTFINEGNYGKICDLKNYKIDDNKTIYLYTKNINDTSIQDDNIYYGNKDFQIMLFQEFKTILTENSVRDVVVKVAKPINRNSNDKEYKAIESIIKRSGNRCLRYFPFLIIKNIIYTSFVIPGTKFTLSERILLYKKCDGDLNNLIKTDIGFFTDTTIQNLLLSMTYVLQNMYLSDLAHGDIKLENILYKKEGEEIRFYISDLGFVRKNWDEIQEGTPGYCTPFIIGYDLFNDSCADIKEKYKVSLEIPLCYELSNLYQKWEKNISSTLTKNEYNKIQNTKNDIYGLGITLLLIITSIPIRDPILKRDPISNRELYKKIVIRMLIPSNITINNTEYTPINDYYELYRALLATTEREREINTKINTACTSGGAKANYKNVTKTSKKYKKHCIYKTKEGKSIIFVKGSAVYV